MCCALALIRLDNWMPWLILVGFSCSVVLSFMAQRRARQKDGYRVASREARPGMYEFYVPTRVPFVPRDRWKEQSLETLWALIRVEDIRAPFLPDLAVELLERGFDSYHLRQLASEFVTATTVERELYELAEQAFSELMERRCFGLEEAKLVIARLIAAEALNGERESSQCVSSIAYLYDWQIEGPAGEFTSLNYAYEDLSVMNSSTAVDELSAETKAACRKLLDHAPQTRD